MPINKNPFDLPTEKIDLPSKGLVYPEGSPLRQGYVEAVYPSARQEDILTNANYLDKGIAVDKYLDSILLTEVSLDDMIPGDKDAFMISARIMGLGKDYTTMATVGNTKEVITFDLTTFKEKEVNWDLFKEGLNEFTTTLRGNVEIKFKLLTGADYNLMAEEEAGMRKVQPDYSADTTLFLKHAIVEVNGEKKRDVIRKFVDKMLMVDSRNLKNTIASVSPGYIWKANGIRQNKEVVEDLYVPYTVDFFWPRY